MGGRDCWRGGVAGCCAWGVVLGVGAVVRPEPSFGMRHMNGSFPTISRPLGYPGSESPVFELLVAERDSVS